MVYFVVFVGCSFLVVLFGRLEFWSAEQFVLSLCGLALLFRPTCVSASVFCAFTRIFAAACICAFRLVFVLSVVL